MHGTTGGIAMWVRSHAVARGALGAALLMAASDAGAVGERAIADIKGRDGRDHGRIELIETTVGVLLRLRLKGLPPGPHGIHVHEVGKCEGNFKSAGGIYNPLGAKHGFLNDEGPMIGDLPNIHAMASGEVEAELFTPFLTLAKDAQESLFDANGASVIVKERPDDYRSEPDGGGGARIACGVVTPAK
jgi:Cu-Zn family superoxide dismutase